MTGVAVLVQYRRNCLRIADKLNGGVYVNGYVLAVSQRTVRNLEVYGGIAASLVGSRRPSEHSGVGSKPAPEGRLEAEYVSASPSDR